MRRIIQEIKDRLKQIGEILGGISTFPQGGNSGPKDDGGNGGGSGSGGGGSSGGGSSGGGSSGGAIAVIGVNSGDRTWDRYTNVGTPMNMSFQIQVQIQVQIPVLLLINQK